MERFIFRPEGLLPIQEIIKMYLKKAVDYENTMSNTKYNIQNILLELQETEQGKKFLAAETMQQICKIFDLEDYYIEKQKEFQKRVVELENISNDEPATKKMKITIDDENIFYENVRYQRSNYSKDCDLPKSILHLFARKNLGEIPKYTFDRMGSKYRAVMELNGKKYSSGVWYKNKKAAEQCACLVACVHFKLISPQEPLTEAPLESEA